MSPPTRSQRAAILLVVGLCHCVSPPPSRPPGSVPQPADASAVPAPARAAIREAVEACASRPRDAAAFERLGRIYHGNELVDLAARCYEIALELGTPEARTRYLLAMIHQQRGDAATASERFREAAAREPSYAPAHHNLGQSLLDAGRADEAVAAFREAVRLGPDEAAFHAGLGRALRQAGRLDEAREVLERALALEPERDEAHQLLGLTLHALGRTAEAQSHLERVGRRSSSIVRDPWLFEVQELAVTPETLIVRARVHLAEGRGAGAIELLERAAVDHPQHAALARLLGDAHLQAGDAPRAREAYARAVALDPSDPGAHTALAIVLLQQGEREAAEREAALALAADPEQAMARVVAAGAAVQRGDPAMALETLVPLLARHGDLAAAQVVHGEALAALGRLVEAAEAFARAVELEPRSDYPRRRLAEVRQGLAQGSGR